MKDFIFQNRLADCGFAALKMALIDETKDSGYRKIGPQKKIGNFSFIDLVKEAKALGFILKGYQIPLDHLPKCPSVVLLFKNGAFHYVFLKEIHADYLRIYDPILGKRKIKYKKFYQQFTGYFLKIEGKEKEIEITYSRWNVIPYFLRYFMIFLFLGALIFFIFYFYP